jgi:hypothetical protein
LLSCQLKLFPDIHIAALLLYAPTGNRIQRWSAYCLSGAQAETGVMPGTTNRIIDEEPFVQRGIIVRADVTDGKQLIAPSR